MAPHPHRSMVMEVTISPDAALRESYSTAAPSPRRAMRTLQQVLTAWRWCLCKYHRVAQYSNRSISGYQCMFYPLVMCLCHSLMILQQPLGGFHCPYVLNQVRFQHVLSGLRHLLDRVSVPPDQRRDRRLRSVSLPCWRGGALHIWPRFQRRS